MHFVVIQYHSDSSAVDETRRHFTAFPPLVADTGRRVSKGERGEQ